LELLNERIEAAEESVGTPHKEDKREVKKKLRKLKKLKSLKNKQASVAYMPPLSGDTGPAQHGVADTWLSILPSQYRAFESWVKGDMDSDDNDDDCLSMSQQLDELQRAVLEPCVGGAFYPGIEMTYFVEARKCDHADDIYSDAFRIRRSSKKYSAGDLTRHMAVPWQADFYKCAGNWWPAQRPDDVVPEEVFESIRKAMQEGDQPAVAEGLESRASWARGLATTNLYRRPWKNPVLGVPDDPRSPGSNDDDPLDPVGLGHRDMVDYWHELGIVHRVELSDVENGDGKEENLDPVYIEKERTPYAGMDLRALFYALQNIETNRDCLPKAKEYVDNVLQAARDLQSSEGTFQFLDHIRPFTYTADAFIARMKDIYDDAADIADPKGPFKFDPATHVLRTREQVIERIKQLTPFNFVDGGWLRNIPRIGTADEVNMLLFDILTEELGEGDVAKNHANIYRTLCQSVGLFPPPANSKAFADSKDFMDSSYENPVFQLAISEFSQTYYPEIIGMTLF
ncbi:MAG: LodA/GoxA family CTQ-dependent oxidase, partial [Pseudomonadota bacterium]